MTINESHWQNIFPLNYLVVKLIGLESLTCQPAIKSRHQLSERDKKEREKEKKKLLEGLESIDFTLLIRGGMKFFI